MFSLARSQPQTIWFLIKNKKQKKNLETTKTISLPFSWPSTQFIINTVLPIQTNAHIPEFTKEITRKTET